MRISIVIPALNSAQFVTRGLSSAAAAIIALDSEGEIIVVDNGSVDGTIELLREFKDQSTVPVKILSCDRIGAPAARNLGWLQASGEWIQFLDIDDTIDSTKVARQLAISSGSSWVVGGYRHKFQDGSTVEVYPNDDLWQGLFYGYRTGCTHSNLFTRASLQQVEGWSEKKLGSQDPDLHLKYLRAGFPYAVDNNVGCTYHHHDSTGRVTNLNAALRYREHLDVLLEAFKYLRRCRPSYFSQHQDFFRAATLRVIRQVATYNLRTADLAYKEVFSGNLDEYLPTSKILPAYTRLYPYLGFRNVESLRRQLARVLPTGLKNRLKG